MVEMQAIYTLLVTLSIFWSTCESQTSLPVVTLTPTNNILAPGVPAISTTLCCDVTGIPSAITWKRNNVDIPPSETGVRINDAGDQLTVMYFSSNLKGNYTCVATNGSVSSNTAIIQPAVQQGNFFSTNLQSPHRVTVIKGHPTAIDCGPFNSLPEVNLEWKIKFGNSFASLNLRQDRATVGLNHSLFLLEPSMNDNNTIFSCTLNNGLLPEVIGYVQINVEESTIPPPSVGVIVPPMDVSVSRGETVLFECIPGSNRSITQWILPDGVSSYRQITDTFQISVADVQQSGTYTCSLGEIGMFTATLTLIEPPVFTNSRSMINLTYGRPLSIDCSVTSSSLAPPYWEWFHNGSRLVNETGSVLTVTSTTLHDSGTYQCIVYNRAGFIQSNVLVQVNTISAVIREEFPPTQLAYRGTSFSITCSADGAPPPEYTWYKDNTSIETLSGLFTSNEGTLQIHNVDRNSEGMYMCRARNRLPNGVLVGMDTEQTMLKTIVETTVVRGIASSPFSLQVATSAILYCETQHDSGATITYSWTKDGQPLVPNNRIRYQNRATSGNILIEGVQFEDSGKYQCIVRTEFNGLPAPEVTSNAAIVEITETPVPTQIFFVNSLSPNSFEIRWILPGASTSVSNYTIEIQLSSSQSDNDWVPLLTRSVNAVTSVNISSSSLMAFTKYNVRIVATYLDGSRIPSNIEIFRTGTGIPADSPKGVIARAPSDTALTISWMPPTRPRGEIIDYIIKYRQTNETTFKNISVGSNETSYTIENLPKFQKFEIQVAAMTSAGVGPFSSIIEAITVEGGKLVEQNGGFFSSIGFIVLIVIVVLVILTCLAILVLVAKHKYKNNAGTYHVRHSAYFGKGVAVGGMEATDNTLKLSEDAVSSYMNRHKRAFTSSSPPQDMTEVTAIEGDSLFNGTSCSYTTGTPQLSLGSSARLIEAPSYIDPPSFEETVLKNRSRTQSMSSIYRQGFDDPKENYEQHHVTNGPSQVILSPLNNTREFSYDESDNSIDKNLAESLSGETDGSEYTHYSHLAGAFGAKTSMPVVSNHHKLNLPISADSTTGKAPVSIGELVHNRLSTDLQVSSVNCDTYV